MWLPPQRWLLALDKIEECCGYTMNGLTFVKTAKSVVASRPTADVASGQYQPQHLVQHLKFGQVVVVVQDIPVATAVLSQSAVPAEIMPLELWQFAQVGPIQCVQAAHGLAIGHIPVTQVWAVCLTSTDVTSVISVQ
jgi:hypothetical protein